jgi:hypothetical protein
MGYTSGCTGGSLVRFAVSGLPKYPERAKTHGAGQPDSAFAILKATDALPCPAGGRFCRRQVRVLIDLQLK